jgi:hypothetical protein
MVGQSRFASRTPQITSGDQFLIPDSYAYGLFIISQHLGFVAGKVIKGYVGCPFCGPGTISR